MYTYFWCVNIMFLKYMKYFIKFTCPSHSEVCQERVNSYKAII